jgi:hypothetical protein
MVIQCTEVRRFIIQPCTIVSSDPSSTHVFMRARHMLDDMHVILCTHALNEAVRVPYHPVQPRDPKEEKTTNLHRRFRMDNKIA